jgi:hypothetical protein
MREIINNTPQDSGLGDSLFVAFNKVNAMTLELYNQDASFSGELQTISAIVDTINDGVSTLNHKHTLDQIIGLQIALSGKVSTSTFNTQIAAINASIVQINSTISDIIDELQTKISGSGTNNFITKFTPNSTSIGNSIMANNSNNVTIGSITTPYRLYVLGVNGTANQPLLAVRDNGRVGIRTTTPTAELSIVNTNVATAPNIVTLRNNASGIGTGNALAFINSTNENSTVGSKIESVNVLTNGRNKLGFYVHGGGGAFGGLLERMSIDGAGNALISNTLTVPTISATTYLNLPFIPTNTSDLVNDGEDGTSPFVTINQLPSNLNLFATNASSDIGGYFKLVTSIDDPDYNTTPVDIPTGVITTTGQFIAALVTTAGVLIGNPGIINLLTIGNIQKVGGTADAEFYYEVYQRTSGGTETLVTTSNATVPISVDVYTEFIAVALLNNGTFLDTDRIVIKYYANKVGVGANPSYEFEFGGTNPVRTTFPVPASNLPFSLDTLSDVNISGATGGDILVYNDTLDVWENQSPNFIEKSVGPTYTTNSLITVTQAEYDAIITKDDTKIYFIV